MAAAGTMRRTSGKAKVFAVLAALTMVLSAFVFLEGVTDTTEGTVAQSSLEATVVYHSYDSVVDGAPSVTNGRNVNTGTASKSIVYYGTVISTEYNPQVWEFSLERWYGINAYTEDETIVFTGWKYATAGAVVDDKFIPSTFSSVYDPGDVILYEKFVSASLAEITAGKDIFYSTDGSVFTESTKDERDAGSNLYHLTDGGMTGNWYVKYKEDGKQKYAQVDMDVDDGKIHVYATWDTLKHVITNPDENKDWSDCTSKYRNIVLITGSVKLNTICPRINEPFTIRAANIGDVPSSILTDHLNYALPHDLIIDNISMQYQSGKAGSGATEGDINKNKVNINANSNVLIIGDGINSIRAGGVNNKGVIYGQFATIQGGTVSGKDNKMIIHSGNYANIFGGGNGSNTTTTLIMNGGAVFDTLSGGNQSSININAGDIYLYMTGVTTYADAYIDYILNHENDKLLMDGTGIYQQRLVGESSMIVGGCGKTTAKSTHLYLTGTSDVWTIQAAGREASTTVSGDANMEISGKAIVRNVACGCTTDAKTADNQNSSVNGNVNIKVRDDTYVANLVGGGYDTYGSSVGASFLGRNRSINIDVEGGNIGYIYGGGLRGPIGTSTNPTNININISGGNIVKDVYGGGSGTLVKIKHKTLEGGVETNDAYKDPTGLAYVYGNITINVTGGVINGSLYGGGKSVARVATYGSITKFDTGLRDNVAMVTGNVSVSVSGGEVKGSVFGAGKGIDVAKLTKQDAVNSEFSSLYVIRNKTYTSTSGLVDPDNIIRKDESISANLEFAFIPWAMQSLNSTTKVQVTFTQNNTKYLEFAKVTGDTTVNISGNCTIYGSVYGGGQAGKLYGNSNVHITGGTIVETVYGGGLGVVNIVSVNGKRRVTVGANAYIKGSVYGGSALGTDCYTTVTHVPGGLTVKVGDTLTVGSGANEQTFVVDAVDIGGTPEGVSYTTTEGVQFVAGGSDAVLYLKAGTVEGSIFGGGFKGMTYGDVRMFVGADSLPLIANDVLADDNPEIDITIGGSIYLGGDVGVISNSSEAFINNMVMGSGMLYMAQNDSTDNVSFTGSIMGSGNSCLTKGETTIYLKGISSFSETAIESIHRATNVTIDGCVLELNGRATIENQLTKSNVSNTDYSMYRIEKLLLKNGTILVMNSSINFLYEVDSLNDNGDPTTPTSPFNKIVVGGGNLFTLKKIENYVDPYNYDETYGTVSGYVILAPRSDEAYGVLALGSPDSEGGFVVLKSGTFVKVDYSDLTVDCRCWYIEGAINNEVTVTVDADSPGALDKVSVYMPSLHSDSTYRYTGGTFVPESPSCDKYINTNPDDDVAGNNQFQVRFGLYDGTDQCLVFADDEHRRDKGAVMQNDFGQGDPILGEIVGQTSVRNPYMIIQVQSNIHEFRYLGYVLIYVNEVVQVELDNHETTYIVVNSIQTKVHIYTEADELEDTELDISVVNGSGSATFIIPSGMAGYKVIVDSVTAKGVAGVNAFSMTSVKNSDNTPGWTDSLGTFILRTDGSATPTTLGTLQGGYTASLRIQVDSFSGSGVQSYDVGIRIMDGASVYNSFTLTLKVSKTPDVSVNFHVNSNTQLKYTYAYGTEVTISDCPPTDAHFVGWYTDSNFNNPYTFTMPLTKDLELYARYMFEVTLDYMDGTSSVVYVNMPSGRIGAIESPTRPGYDFGGWWTDTEFTHSWDPAVNEVISDMTLYARWVGWSTKVVFKWNGNYIDLDPTKAEHHAGNLLDCQIMEFGTKFNTSDNFYIDERWTNMTLLAWAQYNLEQLPAYRDGGYKFIYWTYENYNTIAVYSDSYLSDIAYLKSDQHGPVVEDGYYTVVLVAEASSVAVNVLMDSTVIIHDQSVDNLALVDPPSSFLIFPYEREEGQHREYKMKINLNGATRPGYSLQGWSIADPDNDVAYFVRDTPYVYTAGTEIVFHVTGTVDSYPWTVTFENRQGTVVYETMYLKEEGVNRLYGESLSGEILEVKFESKWERIPYSVSIANPSHGSIYATYVDEHGAVIRVIDNTLYYGDTITLVFTPDQGYEFYQWYSSGEGLFNDASSITTTFVVQGDTNLSAYMIGPQIVRIYVEYEGLYKEIPNGSTVSADGSDYIVKSVNTTVLKVVGGTYDGVRFIVTDNENKYVTVVDQAGKSVAIDTELVLYGITYTVKSVNDTVLKTSDYIRFIVTDDVYHYVTVIYAPKGIYVYNDENLVSQEDYTVNSINTSVYTIASGNLKGVRYIITDNGNHYVTVVDTNGKVVAVDSTFTVDLVEYTVKAVTDILEDPKNGVRFIVNNAVNRTATIIEYYVDESMIPDLYCDNDGEKNYFTKSVDIKDMGANDHTMVLYIGIAVLGTHDLYIEGRDFDGAYNLGMPITSTTARNSYYIMTPKDLYSRPDTTGEEKTSTTGFKFIVTDYVNYNVTVTYVPNTATPVIPSTLTVSGEPGIIYNVTDITHDAISECSNLEMLTFNGDVIYRYGYISAYTNDIKNQTRDPNSTDVVHMGSGITALKEYVLRYYLTDVTDPTVDKSTDITVTIDAGYYTYTYDATTISSTDSPTNGIIPAGAISGNVISGVITQAAYTVDVYYGQGSPSATPPATYTIQLYYGDNYQSELEALIMAPGNGGYKVYAWFISDDGGSNFDAVPSSLTVSGNPANGLIIYGKYVPSETYTTIFIRTQQLDGTYLVESVEYVVEMSGSVYYYVDPVSGCSARYILDTDVTEQILATKNYASGETDCSGLIEVPLDGKTLVITHYRQVANVKIIDATHDGSVTYQYAYGQIVTLVHTADSPETHYEGWFRNGVEIADLSLGGYLITEADVGYTIVLSEGSSTRSYTVDIVTARAEIDRMVSVGDHLTIGLNDYTVVSVNTVVITVPSGGFQGVRFIITDDVNHYITVIDRNGETVNLNDEITVGAVTYTVKGINDTILEVPSGDYKGVTFIADGSNATVIGFGDRGRMLSLSIPYGTAIAAIDNITLKIGTDVYYILDGYEEYEPYYDMSRSCWTGIVGDTVTGDLMITYQWVSRTYVIRIVYDETTTVSGTAGIKPMVFDDVTYSVTGTPSDVKVIPDGAYEGIKFIVLDGTDVMVFYIPQDKSIGVGDTFQYNAITYTVESINTTVKENADGIEFIVTDWENKYVTVTDWNGQDPVATLVQRGPNGTVTVTPNAELGYGAIVRLTMVFTGSYTIDQNKSTYIGPNGEIYSLQPIKGSSLQEYIIQFFVTGDMEITISSKWVGEHITFYIQGTEGGTPVINPSMTLQVGRDESTYLVITDYEYIQVLNIDGYYFDGWYENKSFTILPKVVYIEGVCYYELRGNTTLYARYVKIPYEEYYDLTYDGRAQSVTVTPVINVPLDVTDLSYTYDETTVSSISITNVGDGINNKTITYSLTPHKVYAVDDNGTERYVVSGVNHTYTGSFTLRMNPRPIIVIPESSAWIYDGTEHICHEYTVFGLSRYVEDDDYLTNTSEVTFNANSKITNPGSVSNIVSISDTSANYSISYYKGTLVVMGSMSPIVKANASVNEVVVPGNGAITVTYSESSITVSQGGTPLKTVPGDSVKIVIRNKSITGSGVPAISIGAGCNVTLVIEGTCTFIGGQDCDGIAVDTAATLKLTGTGTLTVSGNAGSDANGAGSGIGLASGTPGAITISYMNGLSAYGYGEYAYGIGGRDGSVFIEYSNITNARGGLAGGSAEANGGPGIGGLIVSITDSTITNVTGGPKSAAIGGIANSFTYVEIYGSTLTGIHGGSYSAGIGGAVQTSTRATIAGATNYVLMLKSKLGNHTIADTIGMTTIRIVGSSITAEGGIYGPGVGTGHATVVSDQGLCVIDISSGSAINATGGQYAANIGTGYRHANLTGFLDGTVTHQTPARNNDVDGEHNTYTQAQDVGYGVIDPSAEGSGLVVYFYIGLQKIPDPSVP